MQISLPSKGILAALGAILSIILGVLFAAFGTAAEQVKESRAAFALNGDGSLMAYHFAQASTGGGIQRGIRIHNAAGDVTHVIEGSGNVQVHSPVFDQDGQSLILGTICWSDDCPAGLTGSRLISLDLDGGQWRGLTDDGYQTAFWDFGYVNQSPGSVAIQAMRSDPVVTPDGLYYLISAANVREITTARDFAPRQVTPVDDYILAKNDGTVAFRGQGSMAPFGPDALLIMAGPVRGGSIEAATRDEKAFAYLISRRGGEILQTWTAPGLETIEVTAKPSPRTAAGDAAKGHGFVVAGRDIIKLTQDGQEVFFSGGVEGPRLHDIALSGDGSTLFVAARPPNSDVPALTYFTLNIETQDRADRRLDAAPTPKKTIKIQ